MTVYQRQSNVVPFHLSVIRALAAVLLSCLPHARVLMSACQIWHVIYCINIKHRQNSVVSEPDSQSMHVQKMSCTAAAAAAWPWAAGWAGIHPVHRRRNRVGRGPHRFLTVWAAHVFGPHGIFQLVQRLESRVQPIYSVSQKSSSPKTFCDIFTYGEPV